jgi:beta-glucosidase
VQFVLNSRDLSEVNDKGDRVVAPGAYSISVGGGQPGTSALTAEKEFSISGEKGLPE